MRIERPLVLELERREVLVGDTVAVRVRDLGNRPVEGALVKAGSTRERTDSRGRCEITFRSPGFRKIVAAKESTKRVSYEPTTDLVRALPRSSTARPAQRIGARTM